MKLLELAKRFVLISAFGLWLGGFTVYTAFVIPIGHRHFPDRQFGFLTGEVTTVLGILSAAATMLALVNMALDWTRLEAGGRWASLATLLLLLGALLSVFIVHAKLDALLDYHARRISDPALFEPLHERYELFATIQWAAGLLHLGCLLAGWRRVDVKSGFQKVETAVSPMK